MCNSKEFENLEKKIEDIEERIKKFPLENKTLNRKKKKEYDFRKKVKRK